MLLERIKSEEKAEPNIPDGLKGTRAGLFHLLASKREDVQHSKPPVRHAVPQPVVPTAPKQDMQTLLEDDNFLFKT